MSNYPIAKVLIAAAQTVERIQHLVRRRNILRESAQSIAEAKGDKTMLSIFQSTDHLKPMGPHLAK